MVHPACPAPFGKCFVAELAKSFGFFAFGESRGDALATSAPPRSDAN